MFGYLTASTGLLTEEQMLRYKACYCGLCRCLKQRHGQLSRFTLNYDVTFLVLVLQSLYEDEEAAGENVCPAHPVKKRSWWQCEATAYAADMNIALAYLKCMDNWHDDKNPAALAAAKAMQQAYDAVCRAWPRQCSAMKKAIDDLAALEGAGCESPDEAAATFGALMGEIFVYKEDRWKDTLTRFGDSLGRYLYLLDACIDLEEDVKRGRYNPLKKYHGGDNGPLFREMLKMFLGDAVSQFLFLPLVRDADIIKNILCAGLWTAFDNKYRLGEEYGTGSV